MSSRRTTIILAFLLLGSTSIFGQVTIKGVVTDISNQPVPGANVYLAGSYDGTSSKTDGTFSFSTNLKGTQVLLASFVGYEVYSDSIHLSDLHAFSIILQEEINQMDGVVITAGSFEASDEVKGQVLKPLDIVTTAGATADIAGALNTLPGTQTVGEEGRLFVRGGDAYETTTFIDGMLVVDSYNRTAPNVPTRNRFSPMMFKGTSFSTGGYSAEHGQGLSSALILKTKDVATQNRSDISLMSVGLEAAHTQTFDRSSLSGKIGYINLAPYFSIVPQLTEYTSPPSVLDGNLSYQHELSKGGYFKVYSKFNISDMALNYVPVDSTEDLSYGIKNNFGYVGTSFRKVLNDQWTIDAGLGYTRSKDRIAPEADTIEELQEALHSKVGFGVDVTSSLFVKFGTELFYFNHYQDYETPDGFTNHFSVSPIISATYLEAELYLTRKFLIRAGGRMEYYSLDGASIDPRISAAYQIGKNGQFSLAYGIFRQAPPKKFSRVASDLVPEKATHYIGSYQWSKKNRVFRLEGYWKDYHQLVKFDPDTPFNPLSYSNEGYGYARGVDLFWRDGESIPNSDFWLSYSFLDTQRDYTDYPYAVAPSFSSKHNVSLVYKYFISAWRTQIGTTYSFASGRPYDDPNEQDFMAQRTPTYNDLSLNVSYLIKSNMILYVSATNVLGAENIFGYDYASNPDQTGNYQGRPVTLPAKRFLFVGFFITLSKENTLNQLPNL